MTRHRLFSYGTLQLPGVQVEVFGGAVPGRADAVVGHRVGEVVLTDPVVIALSGTAVHPVLLPAEGPAAATARVEGVVLELDDAQLARADVYESEAYERVEVPLASGGAAWVYRPRRS